MKLHNYLHSPELSTISLPEPCLHWPVYEACHPMDTLMQKTILIALTLAARALRVSLTTPTPPVRASELFALATTDHNISARTMPPVASIWHVSFPCTFWQRLYSLLELRDSSHCPGLSATLPTEHCLQWPVYEACHCLEVLAENTVFLIALTPSVGASELIAQCRADRRTFSRSLSLMASVWCMPFPWRFARKRPSTLLPWRE